MIEICQVKYLNNIEQDHRFIKKITKPMMGFKAFHSPSAPGSVARVIGSEERLVFRHNYPAKAIKRFTPLKQRLQELKQHI
jgi:transposase-like protein